MYAVKPLRYHPREANWQDFHHYLRDRSCHHLPSSTKPWLLDEGSLTQRLLKTTGGNFRVQVLRQQWQRPRLSEQILLDMAPRDWGIIREVALICNNEPWVFARSIIPARSLSGHLRQLRKFKDSSLGAMLFSDPSLHRKPFQIAVIAGDDPQLPQHLHQSKPAWGRRSRFELRGKPIMVSEVFLERFHP